MSKADSQKIRVSVLRFRPNSACIGIRLGTPECSPVERCWRVAETQSLSHKGDCFDNALIERFGGTESASHLA